ncbi:MAG: discoidin domain-containing protein [Spirochaetales bacterium]|nr:discoidin domain-containing protein [Spirochaetales bacterium]
MSEKVSTPTFTHTKRHTILFLIFFLLTTAGMLLFAANPVQVGSGSYLNDDTSGELPRDPAYAAFSGPVPSNDWWQSIMLTQYSDGVHPLPFKYKFFPEGLGMRDPGYGYMSGANGIETPWEMDDIYLRAANITMANATARVTGFSDWQVIVVLSDNTTEKMKVRLTRGSPYCFAEFSDPATPQLYLPKMSRFFNDSNGSILTSDGSSYTGDHIGIELSDGKCYGVFGPASTVFRRSGTTVSITLGGGQTYLSIGDLTGTSDLNYFYQHAYAFVTDTAVSWNYSAADARVTSTYTASTTLKRSGFSSVTLQALFPHQWKYTTTGLSGYAFPSIRGLLKVCESNSFSLSVPFLGIIPSFGEPTGSPAYSRSTLSSYLNQYYGLVQNNYYVDDTYWQGKKLHTLSMAVLIADKIGDTTMRNNCINLLRDVLTNWYTYTSGEGVHYFGYHPCWGTLIGRAASYGSDNAISDHHFHYGYYVYASAILAAYDTGFRNNYGGMVEHLIRDYACPSRTDSMYPFLRNFDIYTGHSWAGGYADNISGNNHESSSEAMNGWAGVYLWGLASGNTTYRNLGIWGYTTERTAIEQYWFNIDNNQESSGWPPEYAHGVIGMVWGSSYLYGTWFSGDAECIYGIQMLPVTPAITYLGYNTSLVSRVYNRFVADNPGTETVWQHIIWPYQSYVDPAAAVSKWNDALIDDGEEYHTYWFMHNMNAMGPPSGDYYSTNWPAYQVFKKNSTYTAVVWNPTTSSVSVRFNNGNTVTVGANSTVAFNISGTPPTPPPTSTPTPASTPGSVTPTPTSPSSGTNLALNKAVTVSSVEAAYAGSNAVDGNTGTRWGSEFSDPQYIYVDLGTACSVNRVVLQWETAYGSSYQIQVSSNASTWTTVYSTTSGNGGTDDISFTAASARYVRMYGTARGTQWGYSLFEFEVYGGTPVNTATPTNTTASTYTPTRTPTRTPTAAVTATRTPTAAVTVTPPPTSTPTPSPTPTTPAGGKAIPGLIEAEDYDAYSGVQTEACSEGGINVGWIDAGDWMDYNVNVAAAGAYTVEFRVASPNTTGSLQLRLGTSTLASASIPQTGTWQTWETITASISLSAGPQTLRLYASGGGWNINWMQFTAASVNLALNKPVTASSVEAGYSGANAVDANSGTRWGSAFSDPQYIYVDLGATYTVRRVVLNWETACGSSYQIQVSSNASSWTTVYSTANGDGGTDEISFPATSARYVRMYGTARATQWGYSLWEFEVY